MVLIIVKDDISASIGSKDNEQEELYSLKEVIVKVRHILPHIWFGLFGLMYLEVILAFGMHPHLIPLGAGG